MQELDPRIIRLGIELNGEIKYYEDLAITAQSAKTDNSLQNELEVTIANIDQVTRDLIMTETSPFNLIRTPKRIIIEAGRVSYGTSRIFVGDVVASSISQPPDIVITLKSLTGNTAKGNIVANTQPPQSSLSQISQLVADDIGATLDFQADDKTIANYSFTGGALKQIDKLNEAGSVSAYLDDSVLVVKEADAPLKGRTRILNIDTGMIGIPELTEQGLKATFLLDNETVVGSALEITSTINKGLNGTYLIYKLDFNIASRNVPFYWIATCKRLVK